MTITEFLNARYDEREAAAREAEASTAGGDTPIPSDIVGLEPAYVLADIAAKRAIVEMHGVKETVWSKVDGMAPFIDRRCTSCGKSHWGYGSGFEPADWPCPTLLALLQPFAEHADFAELDAEEAG